MVKYDTVRIQVYESISTEPDEYTGSFSTGYRMLAVGETANITYTTNYNDDNVNVVSQSPGKVKVLECGDGKCKIKGLKEGEVTLLLQATEQYGVKNVLDTMTIKVLDTSSSESSNETDDSESDDTDDWDSSGDTVNNGNSSSDNTCSGHHYTYYNSGVQISVGETTNRGFLSMDKNYSGTPTVEIGNTSVVSAYWTTDDGYYRVEMEGVGVGTTYVLLTVRYADGCSFWINWPVTVTEAYDDEEPQAYYSVDYKDFYLNTNETYDWGGFHYENCATYEAWFENTDLGTIEPVYNGYSYPQYWHITAKKAGNTRIHVKCSNETSSWEGTYGIYIKAPSIGYCDYNKIELFTGNSCTRWFNASNWTTLYKSLTSSDIVNVVFLDSDGNEMDYNDNSKTVKNIKVTGKKAGTTKLTITAYDKAGENGASTKEWTIVVKEPLTCTITADNVEKYGWASADDKETTFTIKFNQDVEGFTKDDVSIYGRMHTSIFYSCIC